MPTLGLGAMRLSTGPAQDRDRARAVLSAALDAGVRVLDTADAYGRDHRNIGHNEELIAEILDSWSGDPVRVVAKIGLTRPGGAWVPDGRRKHLLAAAEATCERLGRVPDLLLLHALDPRTKLETSVRALKTVHDRGLAHGIGVSNVRLGELRRAREIADIRAVEVAISPLDDTAIRGGLVPHCLAEGIEVFAHSPLGGPKKAARLGRHKVLAALSASTGRSPWALVIAWLTTLGVVPIPGPTSVAHVADLLPLAELDAAALSALDAAFPAADLLRRPIEQRRPRDDAEGDVVLLMGSPASGKTTEVVRFVEQGYHRLNRDLTGGTLAQVADALGEALDTGERRVVLDNTYPARHQRSRVIQTAWSRGVPVRCVYKTTAAEDARLNACLRMVERHGRLLEPEEMKKLASREPNSFPPRVLQRWPSKLEPPALEEGFRAIEEVPFTRETLGPARAVIARFSELAESDRPLLEAAAADGWLLFAVGWTGGGPPIGDLSVAGLVLETHWCTHPPGPPICWCRPPLPGLEATLRVRHGIGIVRTLDQLRLAASPPARDMPHEEVQ